MKKVLSLVLSLVMLLSLVVPVSAEDTYPGSGNLTDKTAAFTIVANGAYDWKIERGQNKISL